MNFHESDDKGFGTATENGPFNDGHIPNVRVVRAALGTGFNPGEGNRRRELPPILIIRFATFSIAVPRREEMYAACRGDVAWTQPHHQGSYARYSGSITDSHRHGVGRIGSKMERVGGNGNRSREGRDPCGAFVYRSRAELCRLEGRGHSRVPWCSRRAST